MGIPVDYLRNSSGWPLPVLDDYPVFRPSREMLSKYSMLSHDAMEVALSDPQKVIIRPLSTPKSRGLWVSDEVKDRLIQSLKPKMQPSYISESGKVITDEPREYLPEPLCLSWRIEISLQYIFQ